MLGDDYSVSISADISGLTDAFSQTQASTEELKASLEGIGESAGAGLEDLGESVAGLGEHTENLTEGLGKLTEGWTSLNVRVNHAGPTTVTTNLQTGTVFPCLIISSTIGTIPKLVNWDRTMLRIITPR
jgi:hypothetical protein